MRAILKNLYLLMTMVSLVWTLPGVADVRKSRDIGYRSLETFVAAYEFSFHKAMAKVNRDRNNISKLLSTLPKHQKKYFLHHFRMNQVNSLPEWKKKGVGYEMTYDGNKVFISPKLTYQTKIIINGRSFQFKSDDPNKEMERLLKFSNERKKFSFLNLIIDEAHAVCGTGACILIYLGGAAVVAYLAGDYTDTIMNGDTGTLTEVLDEMKVRSGQCTRDTRKLFFKRDTAIPGEQSTFDDFKKT